MPCFKPFFPKLFTDIDSVRTLHEHSNGGFGLKIRPSADYEMTVDQWSNIITMEWPFPHVSLPVIQARFITEKDLLKELHVITNWASWRWCELTCLFLSTLLWLRHRMWQSFRPVAIVLFRAVLWDSSLNMEKGPYQSSLSSLYLWLLLFRSPTALIELPKFLMRYDFFSSLDFWSSHIQTESDAYEPTVH